VRLTTNASRLCLCADAFSPLSSPSEALRVGPERERAGHRDKVARAAAVAAQRATEKRTERARAKEGEEGERETPGEGEGDGRRKAAARKIVVAMPLPPPAKVWGEDFVADVDWRI